MAEGWVGGRQGAGRGRSGDRQIQLLGLLHNSNKITRNMNSRSIQCGGTPCIELLIDLPSYLLFNDRQNWSPENGWNIVMKTFPRIGSDEKEKFMNLIHLWFSQHFLERISVLSSDWINHWLHIKHVMYEQELINWRKGLFSTEYRADRSHDAASCWVPLDSAGSGDDDDFCLKNVSHTLQI